MFLTPTRKECVGRTERQIIATTTVCVMYHGQENNPELFETHDMIVWNKRHTAASSKQQQGRSQWHQSRKRLRCIILRM